MSHEQPTCCCPAYHRAFDGQTEAVLHKSVAPKVLTGAPTFMTPPPPPALEH